METPPEFIDAKVTSEEAKVIIEKEGRELDCIIQTRFEKRKYPPLYDIQQVIFEVFIDWEKRGLIRRKNVE
jgi:hypothetical protein